MIIMPYFKMTSCVIFPLTISINTLTWLWLNAAGFLSRISSSSKASRGEHTKRSCEKTLCCEIQPEALVKVWCWSYVALLPLLYQPFCWMVSPQRHRRLLCVAHLSFSFYIFFLKIVFICGTILSKFNSCVVQYSLWSVDGAQLFFDCVYFCDLI